jgi:hypothetical protein
MRDGTGLTQKGCMRVRLHLRMQYLNSCRNLKILMLCQINLGKVALSEQAEELVIAKLLSHTISHTLTLFPR